MNFREPFNRYLVNYTTETLNRAINEVLTKSTPINIPKLTKLDKAVIACFIAGDNSSPEAKIIQSAMTDRLGHKEIPGRRDKNAIRIDEKRFFFEKQVTVAAEVQSAVDRLSRLAFLESAKEATAVLGCVLFELKATYSRLRQEINFGRM